MPAGIPTATFAIGDAGAVNARLFAVSMLASAGDENLAQKLMNFAKPKRKGKGKRTIPTRQRMIQPGSNAWIGVLGGGQLGRMLAPCRKTHGIQDTHLDGR